jgi:HEAT repeat protein
LRRLVLALGLAIGLAVGLTGLTGLAGRVGPGAALAQDLTAQIFADGIRLYGQQDYAGAITYLDQVCRMQPQHQQARFYLVHSLVAVKRYDEALREATALAALDPANQQYATLVLQIRNLLEQARGATAARPAAGAVPLDALLRDLLDGSWKAQAAAAADLARRGAAVLDPALEAIKARPARDPGRRRLETALAKLADPQVDDRLLERLSDPHPAVRVTVARLLAERRVERARPLLEAGPADGHPEVAAAFREAAAQLAAPAPVATRPAAGTARPAPTTPEGRKAQELFERAQAALANRQFESGYSLFMESCELDPTLLDGSTDAIIQAGIAWYGAPEREASGEALIRKGILQFFKGDWAAARTSLTRGVARKPPADLEKKAWAYLEKAKRQEQLEAEQATMTPPPPPDLAAVSAAAAGQKPAGKAPATATMTAVAGEPSTDGPGRPGTERSMAGPEPRRPPGREEQELIQDLQHGSVADQRFAAFRLGHMRYASPEALQGLVAALQADDLIVRANALESLGKLGPAASAAVPAILKAIQYDSDIFKVNGLRSLAGIKADPEVAFPVLGKALAGSSENVARAAKEAFVAYGPAAVDYLKDLERSDAGKAREWAREALEEIEKRETDE